MTTTQAAMRAIGVAMWIGVIACGLLSVGDYRPYELDKVTGDFEYEAAEECGGAFAPNESNAECSGKLDTVRSNMTLLAIGGTGFIVLGWIPKRNGDLA